MADRGQYRDTSHLPELVSDWDGAMRDALHHESVEALRHQLEIERQQKAVMERSDYFFSIGVLGLTLGLGYGLGGMRPKLPKWMR